MKRSAKIRIGGIVLDLVNTHQNGGFILLTGIPITDDSNIGQSLDLIMLLELECDLLNPSIGLSIISPSACRNGYTSDEKAEVVWGGKIERLLQSYL
jgi:hypothetical protein